MLHSDRAALCHVIVCAALQQCEDLEDAGSLQHLFRIMRSMVMLNDTQVGSGWGRRP